MTFFIFSVICAALLLSSTFVTTILPASALTYTEKIKEARNTYHSLNFTSSLQKLAEDDLEIEKGVLIIKAKADIKKSSVDKLNKAITAKIIDTLDKKSNIYLVKIPKNLSLKEAVEYYLKQDKLIEYAVPNHKIKKITIPSDPLFSQMWNLHNTGIGTFDADIDAPEAWDIKKDCSDVVVGIMDDGINFSHPDLADNIWINPDETSGDGIDNDNNGKIDDIFGYDFGSNDSDISPDIATDPTAIHGTHVAGTVGAVGNNGIGTTGVCWNVKLMALKIFDKFGSAEVDNIVKAVDYAIAIKKSGVKLVAINMSFGHYSKNSAEFDAMKNLRDNGILVTAAAGNDGLSESVPNYPSSHELDNIISVAASGNKDTLASFSNYGKNQVDLVAPGVDIYSTIPENDYDTLSGTSMATPHVAGVIALVSSNDNALTFDQIRAKILDGADKKSQLQNKVATSARLNAFGALKSNATLPDIAVTINPLSSTSIGPTSIKVYVQNLGGTQSDTTNVELYGSSDPLFESDVQLLSTASVGSLKLGQKNSITLSFNVPTNAFPLLYLRVIVDFDNYVSESNENNNSFDVSMPVITKFDLKMNELIAKNTIKVNGTLKPSIKIQNTGKSIIKDDFSVTLYLSSNKTLDDSDMELGTEIVSTSLKVKKTQLLKPALTISSETLPGTYYLISVIDPANDIPETNESNNIKLRKIKIIS